MIKRKKIQCAIFKQTCRYAILGTRRIVTGVDWTVGELPNKVFKKENKEKDRKENQRRIRKDKER